MTVSRDIALCLREQGIGRGSRTLLGRLVRRAVHLASLPLDFWRAYTCWYSYYRASRESGRRLVCISLIEHMGDILACQPVVPYLRAEEPGALVLWCVKVSYLDVVMEFSGVDGIIPVRCLSCWIALRRWARFDRVVDLHINGRTCTICQIPLRKDKGRDDITMTNYYEHGSLLAAFTLSAGLPLLAGQPELQILGDVARAVRRFGLPERAVVIHCSSNESCRDWQVAHWNRVIDVLHEQYGVTIIEIGLQSALGRENSASYRNMCGSCSVLESAELIRQALLFIGIDSGPAHLANAVGTFGIILLGDYLTFRNYTPYSGGYADGSRAILLRSPGKASLIEPTDVLSAVERSRTLRSGREISHACQAPPPPLHKAPGTV